MSNRALIVVQVIGLALIIMWWFCGCSTYNPCDPWQLYHQACYDMPNAHGWNCKNRRAAAQSRILECPGIDYCVKQDVKNPGWPFGHAQLKCFWKDGRESIMFEDC